MKRKILLCGNNQTLKNDFFVHMEFSFECMSTSERWDDTMCHLKYFQPDAVVYCLYKETKETLNAAARLKYEYMQRDIPVIIIGDKLECDAFDRTAIGLSQMQIYRPFNSKNIEMKIAEMLAGREKEKEIEAEKKEEQRKEKEAQALAGMKEFEEIEALLNQEMILPEEPQEVSNEPKHILIVDDDTSMLKMMKNYLSDSYRVATAVNGKVAMKFLETKHTDLVLLDYEMPEQNGSEVLLEIRSNPALKKLPIVFLTGVADRNKIEEVLSHDIQGYMLKPIDVERLSATIKELIG